jgi:uncharacterized membrane protein
MRPLSGRCNAQFLIPAEARISHIRMPTLVLSTLALLGCAFMVYVLFHWLREELNPKRPVKRARRTAIDR